MSTLCTRPTCAALTAADHARELLAMLEADADGATALTAVVSALRERFGDVWLLTEAADQLSAAAPFACDRPAYVRSADAVRAAASDLESYQTAMEAVREAF